MPSFFPSVLARPVIALGGAALVLGTPVILGPVAVSAASASSTTTTKPVTTTTVRSTHSTTTTKPVTTTTVRSSHSATTTTTTAPPPSAADTWLIKAIGAEAKVGSVRIRGIETVGKSSHVISLLVNGDGEGGGTFTQGPTIIQLKLVGPLLYFNAPKKYWAANSNASQAALYGGKWIEFSALDSRFQAYDEFFNPRDLVVSVFQGHATPLTVSKPTTYQGHKVVIVKDVITVKGKTTTGAMYIAAKGRPYVYKIESSTPGSKTTILFSAYGKAVSISVPPKPINLTS